MDLGKNGLLGRFKWHTVIIYAALIVVFLLVSFTEIFRTPQEGQIPQFVWLLAVLVLLVTIILMLSKTFKILNVLEENGAKLEKVAEALEKNRSVLTQLNQSSRLSEAAKTIAFRDSDRQILREVVFDKLQQQDFESTSEIIDEIANRVGYVELAEQLRTEANNYRNATDQERENQLISNIEKLFDNYQWAKASAQIERLIKAYPGSEQAKQLRQKLLDKKEDRKKVLLNAWDDAVKRRATDRSLDILHELDMYLTPNEGLALQEAARDVFRNKLHNLGVQFALAVSGKNWARALQTGEQIVRNFPNSKMAEEIREKWDILEQRVEQQAG